MAAEPAPPRLEARGLGRGFLRGCAVRGPLPLRWAAQALGIGARRPFWALREVSLSVGPGECLGIVGRNGAGKSTLLALLAGLLPPSEGRVLSRGRVVPLLAPGAALHRELTVLENLRLACALYGMDAELWRLRRDAMVRFAGLEDLLEARVEELSLGFRARLPFCAALFSDPDVLLADEALTAGDAEFSRRCLERVRGLRAAGTAVVLASHDLDMVSENCTRAILLEGGRARAEGGPEEVVRAYLDSLRASAGQAFA